MIRPSRRALLQGLAAAAVGLGVPRRAHADGHAERIFFLYFPDGVVGESQDGQPSRWTPTGSEWDFSLPDQLEALVPWQHRCLFFRGLSLGDTDSGSHPGGAKKLLTAVDHGQGRSIDQHLASTIGADRFYRHLLLGVQANVNGASGDKHISYPSAGSSLAPEDDPRRAFEGLFGGGGSSSTGDPRRALLVDHLHAETKSLRTGLGGVEADKLDLHLDALSELQGRLQGAAGTCDDPGLDTVGISDDTLSSPEHFPDLLRAQLDLAVLASSCGLTRVSTIQWAHHTSDLLMSRFSGTAMHDPDDDMRSHQASHYGASHDPGSREFAAFLAQRQWWVSQYAGLLARLDSIPEGSGTMLDHSLVVLCTEVCDGNLHEHHDMPFVVAGGSLGTGRFHDVGYRRHGDLFTSLARALGDDIGSYGDGSAGPLDL